MVAIAKDTSKIMKIMLSSLQLPHHIIITTPKTGTEQS